MFSKLLRDKVKDPGRLYALSLSAPIFESNQRRHDTLYGGRKLAIAKTYKEIIERDWGIANVSDLNETMNSLISDGQNEQYTSMQSFLSSLSETQSEHYLKRREKGKNFNLLTIVNNYKFLQRKNGIKAWDMGRYISLARWGALVGHISDGEAWKRIMNAADLTQRAFSGWSEYATSYFSGRQYWLEDPSMELTSQLKEILMALMAEKEGLWTKIDWNTPLS